MPVVYVSDTFEMLTGYTKKEILGRNCRFLQAPDGIVVPGTVRQFCDNAVVHDMKTRVAQGDECQFTLINYKKSGEPFINLVTVIPICWDTPGVVTHYVGLQVDMVEQPRAILERMQDGSYSVNYRIADQIRAPPTPDTPSLEFGPEQDMLDEPSPRGPEMTVAAKLLSKSTPRTGARGQCRTVIGGKATTQSSGGAAAGGTYSTSPNY
ncbi:blue light receptor [Gonapodya sp. JEL0774]|nr:blue light receptor [Gonapodya sp. JEL0774]